jgi:AGCS family alanine or glycine:cation symporter
MKGKITLINARSVAEGVTFTKEGQPFAGSFRIVNGKLQDAGDITISGRSLLHSAPLTTEAFYRSFLGKWGKYILAISILLFAFSTVISWSYYGDRAVTFLVGEKYVYVYRVIYIAGFFVASFTDTTIVWALSYITIAMMTVPNLTGLLVLSPEIYDSWIVFISE